MDWFAQEDQDFCDQDCEQDDQGQECDQDETFGKGQDGEVGAGEVCRRPRPQPTYSEIQGRAQTEAGILLSRHFLTSLKSLSLTSLRSQRGPGYNQIREGEDELLCINIKEEQVSVGCCFTVSIPEINTSLIFPGNDCQQ